MLSRNFFEHIFFIKFPRLKEWKFILACLQKLLRELDSFLSKCNINSHAILVPFVLSQHYSYWAKVKFILIFFCTMKRRIMIYCCCKFWMSFTYIMLMIIFMQKRIKKLTCGKTSCLCTKTRISSFDKKT